MTVQKWIDQATRNLEQAEVGTARLDALVLLEDVTKVARTKLLAEPDMEISAAQLSKLNNLLNRRLHHEPLAYVRGRTEFYGHEFLITPAVLEPRPESETMIDLLKALPKIGTRPLIADVGTGSGALGIAAKLELPDSRIDLIDIDPGALKVAKMNVDKFTLSLNTLQGDLLSTSTRNYDVLLCNLPYVPDDYQINLAALHEPRQAIFGGPDGLDLYRKLFKQISKRAELPLYILCESLPVQHHDLQAIAESAGYQLVGKNDFIQAFVRAQK